MSKSPASRKAASKPSAAANVAWKKTARPATSSALGWRTSAAPPPLNKTAACLELLRRESGASLQDLMSATGWQTHSICGFLSGTVRKKLGLHLTTSSGADGVRHYRVVVAGE